MPGLQRRRGERDVLVEHRGGTGGSEAEGGRSLVADPLPELDRARLLALTEAFFAHLEGRTFPGGCFFVGAALEMGSRPGPVKERILQFQEQLAGVIAANAAAAVEGGELADEDPRLLAFELNSILVGADAAFVLRDDPAVLGVARGVAARRLAAPR